MNLQDEREPMYFKCRGCGQSMDDDESVWVVEVKWPTKIKVKSDGQIAYMLAELEDKDVIDRLNLNEIICDSCKSNDVEVKEWDETPDWAVKKPKEAEPESTEGDAEDK